MNAKTAGKCLRPRSIRARMTLGFAAFNAVLMLLFCLVFYVSTKRNDRKAADEVLSRIAQEVRQEIAAGDLALTEPTQPATTPSFLQRGHLRKFADNVSSGLAILVVDRSGRVVKRSAGVVPDWPLRGDAWRTTLVKSGAVRIVLAWPWYRSEHELREKTLFLLALSALVVLASAGGAWILVGRTLSPIDQLARQAQSASTATLSTRLQASSPDEEIARLVETLNDFLARWSETVQSRERFYAAAAHELRTPLQALAGHLEVALSRERPAADYKMALTESQMQTDRLTSLVQDLLFLNQLEAHTARPLAVEFDLADLCENELRLLRTLAEERQLKIALELPSQCEISASWNHATMLVRNLLENAVKYATFGETMRVALHDYTLTICNDCNEGVPTEKLFEPFFRPDVSRTSATGGNGLGLAICRSICDANDWEVALQQNAETLCATVVFKPHKDVMHG